MTTRSMYFQDTEDAKEDENASATQQRDVEVYASLKQAIQSRFFDILLNWDLFVPATTLPILPTSFQGVDDYINHYAAFVLQEVQAQALKGINSKSRLRCSIVQCTYDGSENNCTLYLDTQEKLSPFINTYCVIVPYNLADADEDRKELGQLFAAEACMYSPAQQQPSPRPVSHFTLIQGPPGTGKTKTLLMILNVMQNQLFDAYYERLRGFVNGVVFGGKNAFFSSLEELNKARIQMKEKLTRPRLLVCTPSNAAVNTIVDGIMKEGFVDNTGKKYNPSILRLGSGTSPDHWSVSLDYIVEDLKSIDAKEKRQAAVRDALRDLNVQIDRVFVTLKRMAMRCTPQELQCSQEYLSEISTLIMLFEEKDRLLSFQFVFNYNQFNTRDLQGYLINNYDIILTTLSSSGLSAFDSDYVNRHFSTLIVDEACQATEVSTLIPLLLNPEKCILIGDPRQLPATVLSENTQNNYNLSLFERLTNNYHYSYLLNVQYRCHPKIAAFPNLCFYEGKLLNGENVQGERYSHQFYETDFFYPVVFYNLCDASVTERKDDISKSYSNEFEARFVLHLYSTLVTVYPKCADLSVVILTPYNEQKALFQKCIAEQSNTTVRKLQVSTVDAFQGKEVDLVFYSTVRTGTAYGVGFVSDIRRMNVSFTRPRFGLFVVGNEAKLRTSKYWNQFIDFSHKNNRVIDITDVNCDLEQWVRQDIQKHARSNLYLDYQQKHKPVVLSLHQSVEEEYAQSEGRYSPEVLLPSAQR
ncbi:tRNA splicing endonuclease [Blastocystis sp. ATCC 50177/Nand II]|uniref:tRNA splicing endonuclease n=1 Tax=Blastocystis sp. subtype 1 (strain ATCC 50177 / NandII) TaxID=478820 RepID=A0A196SLQ4_BLAHN|nr:tRNA splicing endonuclease [Blastocystis sp. ATCC 50177/Nand II]